MTYRPGDILFERDGDRTIEILRKIGAGPARFRVRVFDPGEPFEIRRDWYASYLDREYRFPNGIETLKMRKGIYDFG